MSTKPETTFYRAVHAHLPKSLHREKMANPYQGGTWDCWYSGALDLWVEYKFIILPKRPDTLIDINLSALQLEWGRARYLEGRQLAVIVGCKEGGVVFEHTEWEQRLRCADFKAALKSRAELATWIVRATS